MTKHIALKNRLSEDQPREKFAHTGRRHLSNVELISILIGTGTRNQSAVDLAREVLQSAQNNLNILARMTVSDLCKIDGIGTAKAVSILSAMELSGRRTAETVVKAKSIQSSKDAYSLMAQHVADKSYEEFWVILLNRANKLIHHYCISEGSVSGTVADPKRIYKVAIDRGASNIILCHNHPSGNLQPSQADIQLTRKVQSAGLMLDIQVLDHLIIAQGGYYSFADEGQL